MIPMIPMTMILKIPWSLAAGEIGDTAMLEVDVDACDLGQPSAKRIKTTDESADQTCGNMEVVVEDRDAIEIQPAQPAPAPVPILPAPAEVPEAAAAAERVPTPTFIPKVNSDGHKAICTVLLPVLLCVLCEDQWRNRDSRAQVREACWRGLDWRKSMVLPQVTKVKFIQHR